MADWSLFTRDQFAEASGGIPSSKADAVIRRITTGKYVVETPWTPDRWRRLTAGAGLIIRRDGQTVCSGAWTRRSWRAGLTDDNPLGIIALEGVTDDVIGQYRLCAPDPGRPFDQQSTQPTWTRSGPVETLMHALVAENAGPLALPGRLVPGLVMGADQGRGPVVAFSTLRYGTLQDELRRLAAIAEAAGVRLLPTFGQTELGLTFQVLAADDRTAGDTRVVFGAGLGNLDEQEYVEDAGTVGLAVSAGKGEGVMRMQRVAVTVDEFTRAFGVLPEVYIDRRDTDQWDELDKAAQEAVDGGVAAVSYRCVCLDTPGTSYGTDFGINTVATVLAGPPGTDPETGDRYQPLATFDDLVREVAFKWDGATDKVTAAVGTEGASTGVALPSLKRIAALNAQVAQLQRSL